MRIYLKLTSNQEVVPFNYQQYLVGAFHKWLGRNSLHDDLSLYSLSWLSGGSARKEGLNFPDGTSWHISSFDNEIIKKVVKGVRKEPEVCFGMAVSEIIISEPPDFSKEETFFLSSPVFIKRTVDQKVRYFYYDDPESGDLMTETLSRKIEKAGLTATGLSVQFDHNFSTPKKKMIKYGGIACKGSVCPVIIRGSQEQVTFAWHVGIGNSTGIGFGALK